MSATFPLLALLVGCFYVTEDELIDAFDGDGDTWGIEEDCNDDDARFFPGAIDVRGDGCDADCGNEPDADGDDWPDASDCAPDDAAIHPWSQAEAAGDGVDSDCDGADGARSDPWDGTDWGAPEDAEMPEMSCSDNAHLSD